MKLAKCIKFLGLVAFLLSFNAVAQPTENPGQPKKKSTFAKENEPRSYLTIQPMFQMYFMNDSSDFDKIFNQTFITPAIISIGGYPIRNLGINFNAGWAEQKGTAVGDETQESSGEKVTLTVIPVQVEATYRFDFYDEQFLVPVLGVGGDYWYYKENNEFSKDVEGGKSGFHAVAGVGLLLDRIDPTSRVSLREYGIENVILEIEGRINFMDTKGLNLSGTGVSVGLLFEL